MVPEIELPGFAAHLGAGAVVIDVREPFEYVAGHVPGAVLVPLGSLPNAVGDLPRGERVYVICASGNRSRTAAQWLRQAGVDAVSVAGGTGGWAAQGRPVVRGPHARAAA